MDETNPKLSDENIYTIFLPLNTFISPNNIKRVYFDPFSSSHQTGPRIIVDPYETWPSGAYRSSALNRSYLENHRESSVLKSFLKKYTCSK